MASREPTRREELAAMRAEHLKFAKLLQAKALAALEQLDPKKLTPAEALRLLEAGVKLGRASADEQATGHSR